MKVNSLTIFSFHFSLPFFFLFLSIIFWNIKLLGGRETRSVKNDPMEFPLWYSQLRIQQSLQLLRSLLRHKFVPWSVQWIRIWHRRSCSISHNCGLDSVLAWELPPWMWGAKKKKMTKFWTWWPKKVVMWTEMRVGRELTVCVFRVCEDGRKRDELVLELTAYKQTESFPCSCPVVRKIC